MDLIHMCFFDDFFCRGWERIILSLKHFKKIVKLQVDKKKSYENTTSGNIFTQTWMANFLTLLLKHNNFLRSKVNFCVKLTLNFFKISYLSTFLWGKKVNFVVFFLLYFVCCFYVAVFSSLRTKSQLDFTLFLNRKLNWIHKKMYKLNFTTLLCFFH